LNPTCLWLKLANSEATIRPLPQTFRHYVERYKMVSNDSKPAKQLDRSSIHSPFYC